MRRLILIIFIVIISGNSVVKAQNREPFTNLEHMDKKMFQWGYYLGANYLDFKFDMKELDYQKDALRDIQVKKSTGFNVGVTTSFRITDYLHFRVEPGLFYNQRDMYFYQFEEKRDYIRTIRSTYIYFPLLMKLSTKRWYNFKPYVTGGVSGTIDLSSGENLNIDNYEGKFRMKKYNVFYEFGVGIDFYTPYFRFSPSIRGIFSFKDEMFGDNRPDSPWTKNINSIRTQGFLITLIFE